jgi:hypothetical protein
VMVSCAMSASSDTSPPPLCFDAPKLCQRTRERAEIATDRAPNTHTYIYIYIYMARTQEHTHDTRSNLHLQASEQEQLLAQHVVGRIPAKLLLAHLDQQPCGLHVLSGTPVQVHGLGDSASVSARARVSVSVSMTAREGYSRAQDPRAELFSRDNGIKTDLQQLALFDEPRNVPARK